MKDLRLAREGKRPSRAKAAENVLREGLRLERVPDPSVVVLFGATGDLAHRKVIPAIYQLWRTNLLPHEFIVLAIGRRPYDDDSFRAEIRAKVPMEQGMWAAPLWFRPADGSGGEIDLVETLGSEADGPGRPRVHQTIHTDYGAGHDVSGHSYPFARLDDPAGTAWGSGVVVAVEINRSVVRSAVGDLTGRTLERSDHEPPEDGHVVAARLHEVLDTLAERWLGHGRPVRAVAVSIANPVDPATGRVVELRESAFPAGVVGTDDIRGVDPSMIVLDNDVNFAALAERNLEAYLARLARRIESESPSRVAALVEVAVEEFVAMKRAVPGFGVVDFGVVAPHGGPAEQHVLDAVLDNNAAVAVRLRSLTCGIVKDGAALRDPLALRVAMECADAVLQLAFRTDPDGDPAMIAEGKRVLRLYLTDPPQPDARG